MTLVDQHAEPTREIAVALGQRLDVLQPLGAAPLIHHERIVDPNAIDVVDTQRRVCFVILVEPGPRLGRAGWRERTGLTEDHDTLGFEDVVRRDIAPTKRIGPCDRLVANARLERYSGNFTTDTHGKLFLV